MIWWTTLALAGPETGVNRLLELGKVDKAQAKCERLQADAPGQPMPLREACAQAMWSLAEAEDTYARWTKFRLRWEGTSLARKAKDRAAASKLEVIGDKAAASTYGDFLTEFAGSEHVPRIEELYAQATFREIVGREDAVAAAKRFPTHRDLPAAIQPFFEAFVEVKTQGDDISVRLTTELPIPGAQLSAEWAGKFDGDPLPLDEAVERHLSSLGVSKALVKRYARHQVPAYPPCDAPEMDLGIVVRYGDLSSFHPVSRVCGGEDTAFLAEEGGRIVGLTLAPGTTYRFGVEGRESIDWVHDTLRTSIPLLGERQDEVVKVGSVLGQQVGPFWLLHPMAGGMPWYVKEEPPPTAKPLPNTLVSVPVPQDVQLVGLQTGDTRLERPGQPAWTRELPPGKVRVVSRWFSEITGLHDKNKVFDRKSLDPLPSGYVPAWSPIPAITDRNRAREALSAFGIRLSRAWEVAMQDQGAAQIVFEGSVQGSAVKGVLDPRRGGGHRLFVFYAPRTGDPLVFQHQGHTWVAFRGDAGTETLCFEPAGLVRRLVR